MGAAVGGAATGFAVGAATGPVGAVIGAVAGGIAGGYAGKAVGEMIDPTTEDNWLRDNFSSRPYVKKNENFDKYTPAYRYGGAAEARYQGKPFNEIEPEFAPITTRARQRNRCTGTNAAGDRRRLQSHLSDSQRASPRREIGCPGLRCIKCVEMRDLPPWRKSRRHISLRRFQYSPDSASRSRKGRHMLCLYDLRSKGSPSRDRAIYAHPRSR